MLHADYAKNVSDNITIGQQNNQSGCIFAGGNGYLIKVKGNTDLKDAIITSPQKKGVKMY